MVKSLSSRTTVRRTCRKPSWIAKRPPDSSARSWILFRMTSGLVSHCSITISCPSRRSQMNWAWPRPRSRAASSTPEKRSRPRFATWKSPAPSSTVSHRFPSCFSSSERRRKAPWTKLLRSCCLRSSRKLLQAFKLPQPRLLKPQPVRQSKAPSPRRRLKPQPELPKPLPPRQLLEPQAA